MRSAQVYRWQIPMDAGVVLRDRRLKTRDGLYVCLRDGEREGWGEISPLPGFSQETWEEAQTALLTWVNDWLQERGITRDAFGRVWRKLRAGGTDRRIAGGGGLSRRAVMHWRS